MYLENADVFKQEQFLKDIIEPIGFYRKNKENLIKTKFLSPYEFKFLCFY